jgi:hypothetical protein
LPSIAYVTLVTTLDVPTCDLDRVGTESKAMTRTFKTMIATRILLLVGALAATPAAAATFDGAWNVQIASQNRACGDGVTVSIGINNGQVASSDGVMAATGRVADSGSINVTLISGLKRAVGSGHLTATSGSGTWRGPLCSGTWTAQHI